MTKGKKAAPKTNPLFEAFEQYATNLAAFHEARDTVFATQKALKESADRLAGFGIYVSTTPRPNMTEPLPEGEADAPPLHTEAPTIRRTPSAAEVAQIRSEAYGSDQEDTEALAGTAADTMGKLLGGLGGKPTAGPQTVGHPMEASAEEPDAPNRTRGPVAQRPVEE